MPSYFDQRRSLSPHAQSKQATPALAVRVHFAPMKSLAAHIDGHAASQPDAIAFYGDAGAMSWRAYSERSSQLAAVLKSLRLASGERVAVLLPDGDEVILEGGLVLKYKDDDTIAVFPLNEEGSHQIGGWP